MGEGLTRVAKHCGGITIKANDKKVHWVYDFHSRRPRIESEMSKEEKTLSEIARKQK